MNRFCVSYALILLVWIFFLAALHVNAQPANQAGPGSSRVSGQMGFHSQWYSIQSEQDPFIYARRPNDLYRFLLAPVFHVGDLHLPVTIIFSSRQTNTVSFAAPNQDIGQFLRNPMNTFRIAPAYKWARATIGTQVLQHGSFTTGDVKLFGAGLELTPGKWHVSIFSGTSQRAIEADSLRRIPGLYERRFKAARVMYGRADKFHISLSAAHMKDDPGSLEVSPRFVRPQEGVASAMSIGIPLSSSIMWQTEIAGSVFSRDTRSGLHQDFKLNMLEPVTDLYNSTRADYAGQTSISYARSGWGSRLRILYIGDGFVAPGFPYLQTDRIDITIDPHVRLLDNNLIVQGSFGFRRNNLSETKMLTTDQMLISLNANMSISQSSGISAMFSNFGIRTGFTFDTLRLEIVSNSFQVSPFFNLPVNTGSHRITTSLSYDEYNDTNLITGEKRDQQSLSAYVNHQFVFEDLPLSTTLSMNYLSSLNQVFGLSGFSVQAGTTWRLKQDRMHTSLGLAFNSSSFGDFSPDKAWLVRPGFRYTITRQIMARIDGSIRIYRYGSAKPGTSFSENMLRTALNYRF